MCTSVPCAQAKAAESKEKVKDEQAAWDAAHPKEKASKKAKTTADAGGKAAKGKKGKAAAKPAAAPPKSAFAAFSAARCVWLCSLNSHVTVFRCTAELFPVPACMLRLGSQLMCLPQEPATCVVCMCVSRVCAPCSRPELRAEIPEASLVEISQLLDQEWRNMNDEEKAAFEAGGWALATLADIAVSVAKHSDTHWHAHILHAVADQVFLAFALSWERNIGSRVRRGLQCTLSLAYESLCALHAYRTHSNPLAYLRHWTCLCVLACACLYSQAEAEEADHEEGDEDAEMVSGVTCYHNYINHTCPSCV